MIIGKKTNHETPEPVTSEKVSAEEREKFNREMEAFQELMGYNADVAYGVKRE